MASATVNCPECETTLNLAKAVEPGKKIRCPRCSHVFAMPGEEPAPRKQVAIKKGAAPKSKEQAKPPKSKPAPPKPSLPIPLADDDDEDSGGVYGLESEDASEGDNKPKIEYAPDLSVKDPRGPASAKLAIPTNLCLFNGAITFFGGVFIFAFGLWPFVFADYMIEPKMMTKYLQDEAKASRSQDAKQRAEYQRLINEYKADPMKAITATEKMKEPPDDIDEEDLRKKSADAYGIWEECCDLKTTKHIILMIVGFVAAIWGGAVGYAAVRTVNLEVYAFGWVAAVMAIIASLGVTITGLIFLLNFEEELELMDYFMMLAQVVILLAYMAVGLIGGIMLITKLKEEDVKEAYEYVPE